MRIGSIILGSLLLLYSGNFALLAIASAETQQPAQSDQRTASPIAQNANQEPLNGTTYRGNMQRTGVYDSPAVLQLHKAEMLSAKLFKIETTQVHWWGDWYNMGGSRFYLGGSYETSTGIDFSPPLFANNVIYFKIDFYDQASILYAVDVIDGKLKWSLKSEKGAFSFPTVVHGILYVGAGNGIFYALDPTVMKTKWTSPILNKSGVDTVPQIYGGILYFGSNNGIFYALNAQTGQTLWEFDTQRQSICKAPAISGDTIFFCTYTGSVYALNTKTGRENWRYKIKGGTISLTISDGIVYCIDVEGHIHALDAGSGKELSGLKRKNQAATDLAILEKTIYFVGLSGNIFAVDAVTEQKKWEYDIEGHCRAPIIAEKIIYTTCSDNRLYALNATTGEKIWATKPNKWSLSAPIIANGVIYLISEDGYLHAVR
jgi:outer membrane protein assembly factor BamB